MKGDKELRELKKLFDELNEKLIRVKNGSDLSKVVSRNEYELIKCETFENLDRLSRERLDKLN